MRWIRSYVGLSSTRQTMKEDKALVYEDWKECILPLITSAPLELNPKFFGAEQYFAAKSLISSRSFEIDDYHAFGMVPLADLFNHKTGAEDVHFTSSPSHCESDNDVDGNNNDEYDNSEDDVQLTQSSHLRRNRSLTALVGKNFHSVSNLECSSALEDDPTVLEMIIVKNVKAGSEVFNTYGSLGNAALLHRYGFTEPDNPYDIVNIDLEVVLQWSSSLFSDRHSRARLLLWKRLNYSGCGSQNSEYFEISSQGEPEVELLILLCIMLLPEEAYCKLDLTVATAGNFSKSISIILSSNSSIAVGETLEMGKNLLLTRSVCDALLSLADIRESFYGSNSIEDDIKALRRCCCNRERKLYHSLMLRVSERKILEKLRTYATASAQSFENARRISKRKKLKRT
ncbi:hypothetical protein L1049_021192 [Liquidambar formosana]|uniref:N-lysine methyltransferase n=1 Tax=Liquidambar formosana TaxID=63359 RepID=A0AAP0SB22_LIQFO